MMAWCLPTICSKSSIISSVTSSSSSPKSINAPVYAPCSGTATSTGPFGSTVLWEGELLLHDVVGKIDIIAKQTLNPQLRPVRLGPTSRIEFKSCSHRHTGGAFEFAPTDPRAFDRAQNCFPDAITEHRPINQSHR